MKIILIGLAVAGVTHAALAASEVATPNIAPYVLAVYSPADLIIPNKFGFTIGLADSRQVREEFEYLSSSLTPPFLLPRVGEIKDQRFSLIHRTRPSDYGFHFNFGVTLFRFSARLNKKYADAAHQDVFHLESLGLNVGMGHRWSTRSGWDVGVDWITWAQPLIHIREDTAALSLTDDENIKDDIRKILRTGQYFPRLTVLKIQLGRRF